MIGVENMQNAVNPVTVEREREREREL